MKLTRTARAFISIALCAATLTPLAVHAANSAPDKSKPGAGTPNFRSVAKFEGSTLDLSEGWGDARACWVDDVEGTTCFRTETDMDKALLASGKLEVRPTEQPTEQKGEGARRASCSSSMRVYSNNYYNGYLLYLNTRWTWINLSWFGFDNVVSSYKIGSCSSTFRSGSYGGGTTYWGGTGAWAQRGTMSGWNNVLSSIYIH